MTLLLWSAIGAAIVNTLVLLWLAAPEFLLLRELGSLIVVYLCVWIVLTFAIASAADLALRVSDLIGSWGTPT